MIDTYNSIALNHPEIIQAAIDRGMQEAIEPMVLVRCIAYNQEKYIEETLRGFVNQKTDFSFIAIVHDDASTDETPIIIKKYAERYPDIIVPVLDDVNRHTEKTLTFIMDELVAAYRPKYVAICEGDDFWTDPFKLQKQVQYMEEHRDCVLCHGDYEVTNGSKRRTPAHYDDEPYFGPGHLHTYNITSLTVLYRYETYKIIPNHRNYHQWLMGDYPLWIELSREGKFHYFPDVFGMYRVLPNSYSHSTDGERIKRFWHSWNDITKFYSELYGYQYVERPVSLLYEDIQKQCYNNRDIEQAKKYWAEGRSNRANSLKSFLYYFTNVCHARWIFDLLYRNNEIILLPGLNEAIFRLGFA